MQARDEAGAYRESNKATVRLVLWTLAWVASLALAKFGPELLWDSQQTAASWGAVAANLVVGIGWIVAFTRFSGRSMSCNERSFRMRWRRPSGWGGSADSPMSLRTAPASSSRRSARAPSPP